MNATITVVCYKSKILSNGEHPLMLRICKDGKKKYQSLGVSIKANQWDFVRERPKPTCPNKEYILKLILDKQAELQQRMLELNTEQKEYTTTTLLQDDHKKYELKTVKQFYQELIEQYMANEKYGNRIIYEKWLRSKGNKETTMSLLFRTLRSAYNKAIESKCARKSDYPFNDYRISKFDVSTEKRAIAKADVLKFSTDVRPIGKRQYVQLSKDIFIFSYLCGGINFTDIANLTKENIIEGKRLHYIRQKTGKLIKLGLSEEALQIIGRYAAESKGYLFPILNAQLHKTPLQKQNRIHKMLGKVNKNLKQLAAQLGVESNVTTYTARHSFASVLKKSGVNIALISEALGHSDLATTQIYLDSFDNEQVDEAMKNLL